MMALKDWIDRKRKMRDTEILRAVPEPEDVLEESKDLPEPGTNAE